MNLRLIPALFIFVVLFALYNVYSTSCRDPTSPFFRPRVGYAPAYSNVRIDQAEAFIGAASDGTIGPVPNNKRKKLCVGIPSIAWDGARYLRTSVGSILDGLTPEERGEIHLIVFIAQSDPTVHPAYKEQWLPDLANEVLTYEVSDDQMKHIKDMEDEGGLFREKGLYDYSYLLKACYKESTPYITLLEDDIVAMDGWYHRTMAAIERAEALSAIRKEAEPDFLYLRLFYTEEFFGWNNEHWKTYMFYSSVVVAIPMVFLLALRTAYPTTKRLLTSRIILLTAPISIAVTLLFFSIGRLTVRPLPIGVNYMPKYGCCSQGLVFPRDKAMELVHWFEERKYGLVDSLTEEFADQNRELRWAIIPSVIQHIGRKSSKTDDYGPAGKWGMSVAGRIWNFGFEKYDADDLRMEHDRVGRQRPMP